MSSIVSIKKIVFSQKKFFDNKGGFMFDVSNIKSRVIKTDVLAIGASGAGSLAAIAARRQGCEVTIVAKGKLGKSGNAIMAGGSFSMDGISARQYGEKKADPALTPNVMFEDIVKQSFYLAEQDIVEQFVKNAGPRISEFLGWMEKTKVKTIFLPPSTWFTAGRAIGQACKIGVKETGGIKLVEDVMIIDILVNNGRVAGALGLDLYKGEFIIFEAKAVVLGTGGYQPFSFRNTVTDMTGDGAAMAFRAGVPIADMEFHLFLPTLISPKSHRGSILPYIYYMSGMRSIDLKNGNHDEIVIPKVLLEMAQGTKWSKQILAYYLGKEICSGRGSKNNGIYYHFPRRPYIKHAIGMIKFDVMSKQLYRKNWFYQGEDYNWLKEGIKNGTPLEVGLSSEYSNGGVVVDAKMATSLPGLFVPGEANSGAFGALRIADGVTEMIVQGYEAGNSAAEFSKRAGGEEIDQNQVDEIKQRVTKGFNNKGGLSPYKVRTAFEKTVDDGFNIIRDEKGLQATLNEIDRIKKEDFPNISFSSQTQNYNFEWIEAMQLENLLVCTEVGVRAALLRKESRGTHMRSDFPQLDNDNFLYRLVGENDHGKIKMTTKVPKVTKMLLPTGKYDQMMDYTIEQSGGHKNVNAKEANIMADVVKEGFNKISKREK